MKPLEPVPGLGEFPKRRLEGEHDPCVVCGEHVTDDDCAADEGGNQFHKKCFAEWVAGGDHDETD